MLKSLFSPKYSLIGLLDKAWNAPNIPKSQRQTITLLSVMYFCQLFMYRSIDIESIFPMGGKFAYSAKYFQFLGTILGAALAAFLLWWLRKKKKKRTIAYVLLSSNALLAMSYFGYIYCFDSIKDHSYWMDFLGFLIGAGNSAFIGLCIIWISETIFRHLRTTSALFVGTLGFLGAMVASSIDKIENKICVNALNCQTYTPCVLDSIWPIYYLVLLGMIISSVLLFISPKLVADAPVIKIFHAENEEGFLSIMRRLWKNRNLIAFCMLIGLTVQYWVFIASHSKELFGHGKGSFDRYLGTVIGSIAVLFYYKKGKVRIRSKIIEWSCGITFVTSLMLIFSREYFFSSNHDWLLDILFFITGVLSSIWVLSILFVAEQWDLGLRPWLIILAPNIFRASEIILHWRTSGFVFQQPIINIGYSEDLYLGILLWGMVFAFLGVLASMYMSDDNFEGDPLKLGTDNKGEIDQLKVIESINAIKDDKVHDFFGIANKIVSDHLKKIFGVQLYLTSTYYKEFKKIKHTEYDGNPNAFECNGLVENYNMQEAHRISADLVEEGKHASFIENLFLKHENSGGLMYLPGRQNRRMKSEKFPEFKMEVIDLSSIQLLPNAELKYKNKHNFEKINFVISNEKLNGYSDPLVQTFALFRMDADAFAPETYFLYIIKPIAKDPRCTLVLKTAIELSEDNLRRLRAVISAVQAKWDETQIEFGYNAKVNLLTNSLSSHFISSMIRNSAQYFHKEQDEKSRDNVRENLVSFFRGYMNFKQPFITLFEEQEMLKKYINTHTWMESIKNQSSADLILDWTKIPFDWKLEIDFDLLERNIAIPRGILQPIVQNSFDYSGFSIDEYSKLNLEIKIYRTGEGTLKITIKNNVKDVCEVSETNITNRINGRNRKNDGTFGSLYCINNSIRYLSNGNQEEQLKCKWDKDSAKITFEITLQERIDETPKTTLKGQEIINDREEGNRDLKTLIVDDTASDAMELCAQIKRAKKIPEIIIYNKDESLSFDEAKRVLATTDFDLIIADLSLGRGTGNEKEWSIELFKLFKEKLIQKQTGIVIISNAVDRLEHVNQIMNESFPKNYLGFIVKFEGVEENLNNCLNKFYHNNKQKSC